MASTKRCHYEVLGVSREATADEIRAAYKKLALQRHPDKLIKSGLSQAEATSQFQELLAAYEVLSDPKERAWYDSHRSQILFSDPDSASGNASPFVPNLFSYFSNSVFSGFGDTGKGFYKVFSDVFNSVYANEVSYCRKLGLGLENLKEAPLLGNLDSGYDQVTAFYNYWLGFVSVMDFCWVDQYDAMAGVNRKSRRVMEEENKKLRKKAKKEYNDTVRGLAEFVKKRDKRVIDMAVKRGKEMEKRKEEERERKLKLERERLERARAYEEPEWARVNEEEEIEGFEEVEEESNKKGKEEFYCMVCGKKFKSEKQWKNHEQSKKHKEKVAELRESFRDEDEEDGFDESEVVEDGVDEIEERFKEDLKVEEEDDERVGGQEFDGEEDGVVDAEVGSKSGEDESDDGEMSVREAMMLGRKSEKCEGSRRAPEESHGEVPVVHENDDFMEYNNRKSTRRRGKKERGRNSDWEDLKDNVDESERPVTTEEFEESTTRSFAEKENDGKSDDRLGKDGESANQSVDKKAAKPKETNTRSKNSSKGKKGKAAAKNASNACEKCGEEFESRNKLHKHLNDTGHASLKFR